MENNFKEPTSIVCNREKKSKAVKRLKEEGLVFHKVFDRFLDFVIYSKSDEIYTFMSKHTKKLLVILFFIGGAILGYFLIGKNVVQWAATSLEMIDKVMK